MCICVGGVYVSECVGMFVCVSTHTSIHVHVHISGQLA